MNADESVDSSGFRRGFRWEGGSEEERREVIDAAFDYRGNVTLSLRGGEELEGYVANRDFEVEEPFLQLLPTKGGSLRRIPCADVERVGFSGKDTAEGKSFATWLAKYEERKASEANGEVRESIDLYPEPLE